MSINKVTYKEILRLNESQLTELMLLLIQKEAHKYKFEGIRKLFVPSQLNIPDEGEDGLLICENTNGSIYLQNGLTLFQSKAEDLSEKKIFKEFFSSYQSGEGSNNAIALFKPQIKETLDNGGQYLFFIGRNYNSAMMKRRLAGAKSAMEESNRINGTNYRHNQVRIIDAYEIADWANNFLEAVIRVQEFLHIHRPAGLQTIGQLGNLSDYFNIPYQRNQKLDKHISEILLAIEPERSVLRIIGHSGLGKTRLVYEAFKHAGQENLAVYYNVSSDDGREITHFIQDYGTSFHSTIVVDNCSYELHEALKPLIKRINSTFRLITIDYNVGEETDVSKSIDNKYLIINKSDFEDIVKLILEQKYGDKLNERHRDQIAEYAEGFPSMAVRFAQSQKSPAVGFHQMVDDEILMRIAFGRDWKKIDAGRLSLLQAISVFTHVFYPAATAHDLLRDEEILQAKKQREFICNKLCVPEITTRIFGEGIKYFIQHRVIERRGNYVQVRPLPLAIKLAMRWWEFADESDTLSIFEETNKLGLTLSMINRFSQLNQLLNAQQIVKHIWGPGKSFSSYDFLNTDFGARLFRSVIQVNPPIALKALEYAFGNKNTVTLKQEFGPGRRDIIWALEKIVFHEDLFKGGALLLARLAAAENENIINNATGQLMQLFQVLLPGTEATLVARVEFIEILKNHQDREINKFAVSAMLRGLQTDHFRRDGGAEDQGSSVPLDDFVPSWPESANYWNNLIDMLLVIAKEQPEKRGMIKEAFAYKIRGLFSQNMPFLIEKIIYGIHKFDQSYWSEAVRELSLTLEYDFVNDDDRVFIDKLQVHLKPLTLADQIQSYVSVPLWKHEQSESGEYVDHGAIGAENFAERLYNNSEDISIYLPQLLRGDQFQAYPFGKKMAQLNGNRPFADKLLSDFQFIPVETRNATFIGAYVSELPIADRKVLFQRVLSDAELFSHAFYFAYVWALQLEDLDQLFGFATRENLDLRNFGAFTHGRGLQHLPIEQVKAFFEKLSSLKNGGLLSLELSVQYIGKDEEKWNSFRPFILQIIMNGDLLLMHSSDHFHSWQQVTDRFLNEEDESELAENLTLQLVEAIKDDQLRSLDGTKPVVRRLIKNRFRIFWNIIGPLILGPEFSTLRFFLGSNDGPYGYPGSLAEGDYHEIISWCKSNEPLGPLRIERMMPLTTHEDKTSWHPLALLMIDEFGDSIKFRDELWSSILHFGSVGSRVPYFNQRTELVSKLLNHDSAVIRAWAAELIEALDANMRRTSIDEQGHDLIY